jgi:hypothetical protein
MKKLLLFIALLCSLNSFAQLMPVASKSFGTIVDLRAQAGTDNVQVLVQGLSVVGDQNGGVYYWNSTSTGTDDGFITLAVTGVTPGRWVRMPNSNTIKGTSTFSAVTLQSAYVISHGLPFTPLQVFIQAKTANAAVPSWVSNINSTSFTVNFSSVPLLGTLNLTFDWLAVKN